jgi:hypothetical protein
MGFSFARPRARPWESLRWDADSASDIDIARTSNALNAGPSIARPAAAPREPSRALLHEWNLAAFSVPMAEDTPKRDESAPALSRPSDAARASASLMNRGVVAAAARAAASI